MVLCGLLSPPCFVERTTGTGYQARQRFCSRPENSPRQMTTVDHNGAAAAKRPYQDAELMPFWGRGEPG